MIYQVNSVIRTVLLIKPVDIHSAPALITLKNSYFPKAIKAFYVSDEVFSNSFLPTALLSPVWSTKVMICLMASRSGGQQSEKFIAGPGDSMGEQNFKSALR